MLLVVFVGGLNLVLDEYAKGALRAAVDEAAQAGAVLGGSLPACQAKADQVRANLLPGPFSGGVRLSCSIEGDEVVATATGRLPSFVPPVPSLSVSIAGTSLAEEPPPQ
jgi:hypothetical protein